MEEEKNNPAGTDSVEGIADYLSKADREEMGILLFRLNPHPMWVYDLETLRFVDVNLSAIKNYGYSREEFLYMTLEDIRPAEEIPRLIENIKVHSEISQLDRTFRHKKKDGSIINVEITSIGLTTERRELRIVMAIDITEQFKALQALRESESKYRNLTENLNQVVYSVDPQSLEATYINKAVFDIFGYTAEEWLANPGLWEQTIYSEDKNDVIAKIMQARESLNNSLIEYRIIKKDGSLRWIIDRFQWERDEHGKVTALNGIISDITERKTVETELRMSEERLKFALKQSYTGGWEIDLADRKAFRTPEHAKIFGYDDLNSEWSFDKFIGHVIPEEREYAKNIFLNAIETKTDFRLECRIRRTDGMIRWIWAAGGHQVNIDGTVKKMAGIVKDITESKEAEQQLRTLMTRLIESEEQMRKVASHQLHDEVGQNLTALSINLNYLLSQIAAGDTKKLSDRLSDSISILNDTMDQIRSIMVELRPSILDDYGLCAALKWNLNLFKERTGINIIFEGKELDYRLPVNVEYSVFRVAQEALHNITKHADAKNVKVVLTEENKKTVLLISDDGRGFDTNEKRAGELIHFGILTMAERIKLIGGNLEITSTPGKGTTIKIEVGR